VFSYFTWYVSYLPLKITIRVTIVNILNILNIL
jgi:hypothetical protein